MPRGVSVNAAWIMGVPYFGRRPGLATKPAPDHDPGEEAAARFSASAKAKLSAGNGGSVVSPKAKKQKRSRNAVARDAGSRSWPVLFAVDDAQDDQLVILQLVDQEVRRTPNHPLQGAGNPALMSHSGLGQQQPGRVGNAFTNLARCDRILPGNVLLRLDELLKRSACPLQFQLAHPTWRRRI